MSKQPSNDLIVSAIAISVVVFALPILFWPSHESAQTLLPSNDATAFIRNPAALIEGARTTLKTQGPLSAKFQGQKVAGEINVYQLDATINSSVDLEKLVLDWTLPNGSEIVSGHTKENFDQFRSTEKKSTTIRVRLPNAENHKIFVSLQAISGQKTFGLVNEIESQDIGRVSELKIKNKSPETKLIY